MKQWGKVLLGLAAVAAATGLVACGGGGKETEAEIKTSQSSKTRQGNGDEITLRFSWWGGDARHQATQEVIELYELEHQGVKIVGEYMGLDGYKEKLMTQLAGNTAPDIMQIDAPWIADLNRQFSSFANLDDYPVIEQSGFDEKFLDGYGMFDGRLIGLPSGINCVTMILNSGSMEKFGLNPAAAWNWDTVLKVGKKVNQQDVESYFLCIDQYSMFTRIVQPYLKQRTGNQLVNDDYTLGFEQKDLTELFTYIRSLFDEKVIEPASQSFMFR